MSYNYQPQPAYGQPNQNLNFYQSSYSNQPVSGQSTPFQPYGAGAPTAAYPQNTYGGGANYGFGAFPGQPGATGQMGTGQSGLRTGWLAAFGTEGYEGEPPLLEELGVNFGHIRMKVCASILSGVGWYTMRVLTLCWTDIDGAQSHGENRESYHGRCRFGWTGAILCIVWHVSATCG